LVQGNELDAPGTIKFQQSWQHLRVKRADVHQQHVRDIVAI
jgi:hypothetical protein